MSPSRPPLFEYGRSIGGAVMERVGRAAGRIQEESPLPADLLESEDEYLVVFDAPGTTASDVQVRFVDNSIEVRIDRFRTFRENYDMVFPGRGLELDGTITLPADAVVDDSKARAELRDSGTLYVYLPKATGTAETEDET